MSKNSIFSILITASVLILTVTPLFAKNAPSVPETQKERESYSIGYLVGMSMKTDAVEADFDMLAAGLRDALDQKDPRVPSEEMKTLIVELKKRAKEIQLRKIQEEIVANAKEAEKFLKENNTKDGVKTTESGLQYVILKEGDGAKPGLDDFVAVNYIGTFPDGTEFDNTFTKGEPALVQADGVIKGWAEALPMMKVGSHWKLFVPPDLAYGRGGMGQRIPPNKVLIFDMELLSVNKGDQAAALTNQKAPHSKTVQNLRVTGEIAKSANGYIIRGKQPQMIWTILDPKPEVLDAFVKSEDTVSMNIRVVSGDNIRIETINGKDYR